jgi:uncharacterized protein (TIGR04255 family)
MELPERRIYANPPLIEAVVEFQFDGEESWDSIFFGQLLSALPEFPVHETVHQASFLISPDQMGVTPAVELKRFWRLDRGMVVTAGPGTLAISSLPQEMPEGHSWERLRDTAFEALAVYKRIVQPGPINRSSLRYINALSFIPGEFRLNEYIGNHAGLLPPILEEESNPFTLQFDRFSLSTEIVSRRDVVNLTARPKPDGSGELLFDIDQVMKWHRAPGPDALREGYEKMHSRVHKMFTQVFRPEVLASFGPLEPQHGGEHV